jgi:hypothetical protein
MKQSGYSRRNFVSAGSILAASAVAAAVSGQVTGNHELKTREMLNAMDFGAKGDGITDDTEAIQRAMDKAALSNGAVFIPEGNYLCSELKVPQGIGIHGLPAWSYRKGMGTVLTLKGEGSKSLINLTGAFGAYLFGLCLNGNNIKGGTHGILVDKPDYGTQEDTPRIDTCRVEKFTGDGIRLERIWCFCVRHSHCMANKGCGLRVRGWDGFILDNWFSGNGKAGYASYDENASNTLTGNRIEWNREGGIVIYGGSHYNISGNYIDRSGRCGIALLPGEKQQSCQTLAITGNVIYRSGKPEWGKEDEYDSSHVRFESVKGLVFTGNALNSGRDDGGNGTYSPDYGIVLKGLESSVIKDNVQHNGALKQLVVDRGEHGEGVIIKDNVGSLRKIE